MPNDPEAAAPATKEARAGSEQTTTLEVAPREEPGIEDGLLDTHSQPVGPLDVHSVPLEAAAVPIPAPRRPPGEGPLIAAATAAPAVAARPVVGATVQATQAAVSTAKQA